MTKSTKTLSVVIVSLAIIFVPCKSDYDYCYAHDENPYVYAATKTPYSYVHGLIENSTVPGCEPMQIWLLCRHGTRFPGTSGVKDMIRMLLKLHEDIIEKHENRDTVSLCEKDIENLKAWKVYPHLSVKKAKHLTKRGEEELTEIGRRFKDYFPEILQPNESDITPEKYEFKSTPTQRTEKSMACFMKGLFGSESAVSVEEGSTSNDTLLEVYRTCKPWVQLYRSQQVNNELHKFRNGAEYMKVVRDVSYRLGFANNLTKEEIAVMHDACKFEKAWMVEKTSPWCAVFTKEELQVFEYEDDLRNYYRNGYGGKMSMKLGCPPLKDLFEHFSKLEDGEIGTNPRGTFYFSHSGVIQTFFTAMGIAEDEEPLTASNFQSMKNRKWRTSFLVPFASNVAAVFYKCDSSNPKVRFYLSEKPLEYEGCENGICDWSYIKKRLEPVVSACDETFCKNIKDITQFL